MRSLPRSRTFSLSRAKAEMAYIVDKLQILALERPDTLDIVKSVIQGLLRIDRRHDDRRTDKN